MLALYLEIFQRQKCNTCNSSTSKAKHHPCQKQMGHTHLSSLERSCQGVTYYKQTILVRESKTRPIISGNLEFHKRRHNNFLNHQLKGYSQEWQ